MLTQLILEKINILRSGWQVAPMLVTEAQAAELFTAVFDEEIDSLDELKTRGITDFLYYDCADRESGHHKADQVREQAEKLYTKPAGSILVSLFRNLEILTDTSSNALLNVFEDVPAGLLVIVTSPSPGKIIPTLQSRMIMLAPNMAKWGENPHQTAIDAYVDGNPEPILAMTLAPSKESRFTRDDALWIIRGLQDAIECGTLSPRYAWRIVETRVLLETTNTIAKYLIDQLLITLACE